MEKCKHFIMVNILKENGEYVTTTHKMNHSNFTKFVRYNVKERKDGHECQELSAQRLLHHILWYCY
jgi:hypothetical protein